jgi:hypothetical protein
MPGALPNFYRAVLNCTAAQVARRSKGSEGARHRSHHRQRPDGLPTHPPGRYDSVVPRFVNSVRGPLGALLKVDCSTR